MQKVLVMKRSKKNIGKYFTYIILCFIFSGVGGLVFAQEATGLSLLDSIEVNAD